MALPLCISTWLETDRPDEERYKIIARSGFKGVSLWIHRDLDPQVAGGQADVLVEKAREAGLDVPNIHAPYDNCKALWGEDNRERLKQEMFYARFIEFASRCRIPVVVVHVTEWENPQIREAGLESVGRLVSHAEKFDVTLAIENTDNNRVIDYLFENLDSEHLGLCYDSSHDALYGRPLGAVLSRWGNRLAATHFSDTHGEVDEHLLPGEGNIDFLVIASAFPFVSYNGPIQLEVHPHVDENMDLEAFCAVAIRRARKLRALITGESMVVDWSSRGAS